MLSSPNIEFNGLESLLLLGRLVGTVVVVAVVVIGARSASATSASSAPASSSLAIGHGDLIACRSEESMKDKITSMGFTSVVGRLLDVI